MKLSMINFSKKNNDNNNDNVLSSKFMSRVKRIKLSWIVILALFVALVLIITSFYLVIIKSREDKTMLDSTNSFDLTKISGYSLGGNLTVISNKTKNTYYIEEKYFNSDMGEEFEFKTTNEAGDEITYTIKNNELAIKSSSQIREYFLSDYELKKTNLLSLSTFITIYNDIIELSKTPNSNLGARLEEIELEHTYMYTIVIEDKTKEVFSKYNEIFDNYKNPSKLELSVGKKTNMPLKYCVFDEDGNTFIDLELSFFNLN